MCIELPLVYHIILCDVQLEILNYINRSVFRRLWTCEERFNFSHSAVIGGHMKVSVTKSDGGEGSGAGDSVMATVMEEGEGEGEGEGGEAGEGESDKSDNEEAICPICLNELDEGEDLLVCSSCHNHLHQHCMDICKWVELAVVT